MAERKSSPAVTVILVIIILIAIALAVARTRPRMALSPEEKEWMELTPQQQEEKLVQDWRELGLTEEQIQANLQEYRRALAEDQNPTPDAGAGEGQATTPAPGN